MCSFENLISCFIRRNKNLNQLTKRDECRLMARYLRKTHHDNSEEASSFIMKCIQFKNLPLLLADVLEGRRNGSYDIGLPEFTLTHYLAEGVLKLGEPIIEKAWAQIEEEQRRLYQQGSSNGNIFLGEDHGY